jgi:endonuclease/exonuclease/phosphatase family metal-dependent hydrolase
MQVMGRRVTSRRWIVSTVAAAALALGLVPSTQSASAAGFSGGTRTVQVTSSSITVAPTTAWASGSYRILASTRRSDLKLSRLKKAKKSSRTTQSVLTLAGLRYTMAPYYYRVQAKRGSSYAYSKVRTVYLRPPTPGLRVINSATSGLALVWSGASATRYVVIQAEDPTMVDGRRAVSLDPRLRQYTPLDLVPGRQYWFQVQAYNGPTASLPSAAVSAVPASAGVDVRAMTYNVLRVKKDGSYSSGNRIAPWSQRKAGVVALIRRADPDILALQEASDWVGPVKGPRMADDLRSTLGSSTWSLARTEVPPWELSYFRTGRYILYKTSVFSAVGEGGHWNLGNLRFAAYQILQHRSTGARVLVLSVHLEFGNYSRAKDALRQQQTKVLLDKVRSYLANRPMPVLYLGDFNSHEYRSNIFDGPGRVFRPAFINDSDEVAPVAINRSLNSSNKYARVAPRTGAHVDHIYVPPGVGVRRFEVVAALSGGRYVGVIPSDHNPVTTDVVLPYRAG